MLRVTASPGHALSRPICLSENLRTVTRTKMRVMGVGERRSESHEHTATGVVDTVTEHDSIAGDEKSVTWADVVRKSAAANDAKGSKKPAAVSHTSGVPANRTKRMIVLKRSFSQNNPVNRVKV